MGLSVVRDVARRPAARANALSASTAARRSQWSATWHGSRRAGHAQGPKALRLADPAAPKGSRQTSALACIGQVPPSQVGILEALGINYAAAAFQLHSMTGCHDRAAAIAGILDPRIRECSPAYAAGLAVPARRRGLALTHGSAKSIGHTGPICLSKRHSSVPYSAARVFPVRQHYGCEAAS